MKTKIILLLALTAVITLSFTFISVGNSKNAKAQIIEQNAQDVPVGGLVSEGQL